MALCRIGACYRKQAWKIVAMRMVQFDHTLLEKAKAVCNNNGTISIRGVGRFIFTETYGAAKKNRLTAVLHKELLEEGFMTASRPTFRVMKNGYDRFAVDDAIERYAARVDQLERQLAAYQEQLQQCQAQMKQLKADCKNMESSLNIRKKAVDSIARLALHEANQMVSAAQKNADEIVRQSLLTARLILTDLSRLYGRADAVKESTRGQLEDLLQKLSMFELPKMPDLRWLEEAEKKMR